MAQAQLAKQLDPSQSRAEKLERADASARLELLIKSLLVFGKSRRDVAKVISR
jgi:hypothetical protein